VTALFVVMAAAAGWQQRATAAGSSMPDVTLHDAGGAPIRLSAFSGKVLLVDFWASWCVPCKTSFPALDALYREYQSKGFDVVAINLDEQRKSADAFLAAHPHRMTVLFDPKGIGPEAFGVKGMPTSYLIDRSGTIRFTHMGYSGDVAASYRKEISQLLEEQR
jgi:thiol-disulfide isomerase/thioredoxin